MYKCTHDGKVTFSDQPCPSGTIGETVRLPEQNVTRDRPDDEAGKAGDDYRRLASERRLREIDFAIETKQRKIEENGDQLSVELSELQVRAEALGYTRVNPPDRTTLSRQDYAIAQRRNNAIAQQDVQNQIQAVATRYQAEEALLDDAITQLYAEKTKLRARLNEAAAAEGKQNELSEQYQRAAKERRLREIDYSVEEKQRKIDGNDGKKRREMDELQAKLAAFGDDPLDESGRQSIYISMQAATLKYQLQNAALNRQIAQLRGERTDLR